MENGEHLIHSFNHTDNCEGNLKGLTKREYFAGLAMQGLLAKEGVWSSDEILAKRSVEIADELLKQLEQ